MTEIKNTGSAWFSFPCSSVGMHTVWIPTLEHGNQAEPTSKKCKPENEDAVLFT